MGQTVAEIKAMLQSADAEQLSALERSLIADTRKGVVAALKVARKRIDAQEAEAKRLEAMYSCQIELAGGDSHAVVIGLDEVGRGPLAGPLAVGAVVLPQSPKILGLNDSKQVSPEDRKHIAAEVRSLALAFDVEYVSAGEIDAHGMTASLKLAFSRAIAAIEKRGIVADVILLDGNPLRIDPREVNVIKGDSKCASIAAASIVAKVARDELMCELAQEFPVYGWDGNKGYGSSGHIEAIKQHGLSPYHRKSFCMNFMQDSLF